jgi:hypothetical protein
MRKSNQKSRSFVVTGRLHMFVTANVVAKDFSEAVEMANKLSETDFVKILGDYVDGGWEIAWITDETVGDSK